MPVTESFRFNHLMKELDELTNFLKHQEQRKNHIDYCMETIVFTVVKTDPRLCDLHHLSGNWNF